MTDFNITGLFIASRVINSFCTEVRESVSHFHLSGVIVVISTWIVIVLFYFILVGGKSTESTREWKLSMSESSTGSSDSE